jgi:hypothetical protein
VTATPTNTPVPGDPTVTPTTVPSVMRPRIYLPIVRSLTQ